MATHQNRDYYDSFAPSYEAERDKGYHSLIDRLETELVLRYATDARVLEAGCGTGLILRNIVPHARRAVGIDLSRGMLQKAHARTLPVAQASVTSLPFSDASFDVVYSFKVLAHVEHIELALAEMGRILRPGGHLLAEFYNPWSLRYLIKRLKSPTRIADGTTDESVYTRYDSLARVRQILPPGFEVVDVRGVRVLTPFSAVHDLPLVGPALSYLESRAADAPFLRQLGGFMIVVAQKPV